MNVTLQQILELVGTLDDAPGDNTARERFRSYLLQSIKTSGELRDYIQVCLTNTGAQYNRALQDLVNHAARLIGFDVQFGRYQGAQGGIGFDGIWRTPNFAIVVEAKTTDLFAIQTATLLGYMNQLISEKQISDGDHALGLYVVGRPDAGLRQLENAIVAEKRAHQLRVTSVESVISIAELVQAEYVTRDEAFELLKPSGVRVDGIVELLSRIAAKREFDVTPVPATPEKASVTDESTSDTVCWLTPIKDQADVTAKDAIRELLGAGWYLFGPATPGRKEIKPGDRICFYETGVGIIASAVVASRPDDNAKPAGFNRKRYRDYPWAFRVKNGHIFEQPVIIDLELRTKLDAYKAKDPVRRWNWFVQATHKVSHNDFESLIGRASRARATGQS